VVALRNMAFYSNRPTALLLQHHETQILNAIMCRNYLTQYILSTDDHLLINTMEQKACREKTLFYKPTQAA
jgi:hypothetical protein